MKTNIHLKIQQAWAALIKKIHTSSHEIAAITCGVVMGILFMTNVGLYEAQHFQGQLSASETISSRSEESSISSVETESSGASMPSETTASGVSSKTTVVKPALHKAAEETNEQSSDTDAAITNAPAENQSQAGSESISNVDDGFPSFGHTSFPVAKVPNWGAMRTPEEWDRTFGEMTDEDFVGVPRYDMNVLTAPMTSLTTPLRDENIPKITAKLFYSTRYMGSYNLDAAEFTGTHPALDLKLARGTPIGAIAGGRVSYIGKNQMYGLHVVIEHRIASGETFYSIYGHLDAAFVKAGDTVLPGTAIGTVGMTGQTTAPHLHLQIDRGQAGETHHTPYLPGSTPSAIEAARHSVNPIRFIAEHRNNQ